MTKPKYKITSEFDALLGDQMEEIREMLKSKNAAYGNSALEPVRIFSHAGTIEQLKVRIDDKLSRIMRGNFDAINEDFEEVINDLIGYLFILKMAKAMGE